MTVVWVQILQQLNKQHLAAEQLFLEQPGQTGRPFKLPSLNKSRLLHPSLQLSGAGRRARAVLYGIQHLWFCHCTELIGRCVCKQSEIRDPGPKLVPLTLFPPPLPPHPSMFLHAVLKKCSKLVIATGFYQKDIHNVHYSAYVLYSICNVHTFNLKNICVLVCTSIESPKPHSKKFP